MIGPEDLTWFLELAERGHMTRAAERLGVSQPALSHWLKKMENDLGKSLFRRGRQGMELTAFGKKLKSHALPLRQSWQDFMQSMDTDDKEQRARFGFGIHASVAIFALPLIYRKLSVIAPGVRLTLQHGLSRHITENIISKRLDAGLVVNPVPHGDLVIKELYKDLVRPYAIKGKIKDRLIVHPGLFQSQELQMKLKDFPNELIETESLEVAAHLALSGEGIALLPGRVAKALGGERLQPMGAAAVVDKHCLVYRPTLRETQAGLNLIQAIRETDFK